MQSSTAHMQQLMQQQPVVIRQHAMCSTFTHCVSVVVAYITTTSRCQCMSRATAKSIPNTTDKHWKCLCHDDY
eukprot:18034-Heterococcus_DN1.PRE.1